MDDDDVGYLSRTPLFHGNCLEALELHSICFSGAGLIKSDNAFIDALKFLFPLPNKETGLHRFGRLNCLKLWDVSMEEAVRRVPREVTTFSKLFEDEKRAKVS